VFSVLVLHAAATTWSDHRWLCDVPDQHLLEQLRQHSLFQPLGSCCINSTGVELLSTRTQSRNIYHGTVGMFVLRDYKAISLWALIRRRMSAGTTWGASICTGRESGRVLSLGIRASHTRRPSHRSLCLERVMHLSR
jgi:hypothetical protein